MSQLPLIINLSSSGTGKFDERNDILQRDALKRLDSLVVEQVTGISDDASDNYAKVKETSLSYTRTHNAMLIQGGRGSGKTTFLLNALHRLSDPKKLDKPEETEIANVANKLYVLPMIDPTLVETKENIIIVILSMIEAAIAHVADDSGKMEKARQALAEGLGLLDGIGPNSAYGNEWEDASWVMSRGLHKAKKGQSFELKFGVYLETALSMLNQKKAFVLAFDDVDTNFNHGHTILETIRKYLTSPRLVLLLSGDLDLYGRLLRRNIYSTFGEQVLKYDSDFIGKDKHNLSHAVLELEEQYLLKIVPPQNRIPMLPLGGVMQGSKVFVKKDENSESEQELASWANEQIRKLLLENDGQSQSFFDFVSMEHLRLVMGYLQALNQDDKKASRQMIVKVFETRLRTSQVPIDLIERGNFDYALRSAFEWLANQDDAPDLLQFGVPVDPVRAVVLHCLALSLAQGLETSNGGALRALFALALPLTMMRRPENVDKEVRTAIFRFLWTKSSPSLPELVARIGNIDRSRSQEVARVPASSFGSVALTQSPSWNDNLQRVYGLASEKGDKLKVFELKAELEEQKRYVPTENWINCFSDVDAEKLQIRQGVGWFSIDDLLDNRTERFSEVLNLIVYKRFSERGELFRSLSALSLFAVIGDLLMSKDIGDLASHTVSATIPPFKREKTHTYLSVSTEADEEQTEEDSKDDDQSTYVQDDSEFDRFVKNLKDWHAFARSDRLNAEISPSMLGSIASRIHDDLMDLDNKVTSSWKSGQILHRQITNILHGILVLTSTSTGRKESPKDSDRPFREALVRATENKTETLHPLIVVLLSCPLIWVFLNHRDDLREPTLSPLKVAAFQALENWGEKHEQDNSELSDTFGRWLTPPEIRIKIGKIIKSANQRSVLLNGFYDVLNVVPRNVTK